MTHLFVYGTLTFPEVIMALTHKQFASSPAQVDGYIVKAIDERFYPGLVAEDNARAEGFLLHDVDDQSMAIISSWEDDEYALQDMAISVGGAVVQAKAFVWHDSSKVAGLWDREDFARRHLGEYVNIHIPDFLRSIGKN